MKSLTKENPIIFFKDKENWAKWLEKNNAKSTGIWVKMMKKNARQKSMNYEEALEIALCYGWIDALKKSFDDFAWMQRFTPRSPKSIWSKVNKHKALQLIAEGRMKP